MSLVPLAQQDRNRWDAGAIAEGVELVPHALSRTARGPYQLQAAIRHRPRRGAERRGDGLAPDPGAVRPAPAPRRQPHGHPQPRRRRGDGARTRTELALLKTLDADSRMAGNHRLEAVRAHLPEIAGDRADALIHYREAARRTTRLPEPHYLEGRAAKLAPTER